MDISKWLNDERLLANLIGIHIVLGVVLILSIVLRKLLKNGGEQFIRWTGLTWLESASKEAVKGMRAILFWATIALMIGAVLSVVGYHLSGRHAHEDFRDLYGQLTTAHLITLGTMLAKLVGLVLGVAIAFRLIRRLRVFLEIQVHHYLPKHVHSELALPISATPGATGAPEQALPGGERRAKLEETIRHWFTLLERFGMALASLGALWLAGRIVGLGNPDSWARLVLKIITYFMVARLLTLGCRTMFHVFANIGNRHLDKGTFHRYWERIVRLFPLGERCFEAAIWIFAASQCAEALSFIAFVSKFGNGIVQCIGIFFLTRVVIETLHVFINQAFGMYKEDTTQDDQKGQTLVPLLESLSQYVLYFGSALMMLRVFDVDTTPILAGAGVIGLAVGLGAQSFVADLVAGFFILFENQYLVGDFVQIGDAAGKVEAINIRCTQIRDDSGKLVFIPNGQIKTVVNFSKGYVNAVVDIKTPTSASLDQVMRDMAEAGKRMRDRRREVMGDTVIKGLVDLTPADMTIRAVTKVQPGTHLLMQQEYRKILKEVFDENARSQIKAMAA